MRSPGSRPSPSRPEATSATPTSRSSAPSTMSRRPSSRAMIPVGKEANRFPQSESKAIGMEMTDVATVSRARSGDAEAFRLLVEYHSQTIFRVAYRMTGNQHDSDDIVQETFLRAYRQIGRFEERANFGTWLHRIAVNCSLDLLRARGRLDRRFGADPEVAEQSAASDPQQDRL